VRQQDLEGLQPSPVDKPWSSKEEYLAAQYQILRREGSLALTLRLVVADYYHGASTIPPKDVFAT